MRTWVVRHMHTITQIVDISDDEEVLIAECIKPHDAERIAHLFKIFEEYKLAITQAHSQIEVSSAGAYAARCLEKEIQR